MIEESLIIALVCVVFLLHARSALVAILTLPIGVLIAFIAMHALGIGFALMMQRASLRPAIRAAGVVCVVVGVALTVGAV